MAEQGRLVNDTITLDEAMDKLDRASKESEIATAAASAATSRKNAANKDAAKWAKIAIGIHRNPGLPLSHYEEEASDASDEDDEKPPRRARTSATPPVKRDEAIEGLIAAIGGTEPGLEDPDDRSRCVCGHKLGTSGHPPAHGSFLITLRNGNATAIEHARACLASARPGNRGPVAEPVVGGRKKGGPRKKSPGGGARKIGGGKKRR